MPIAKTLLDTYINPYTDFGFKKLFGSEPNKESLISFLNELLNYKKEDAELVGTITDLTFLSNEQVGRTPEDRKAIFDIRCTNQKGEHFIVEMQRAKQNFFRDRSIFYSTFPIQEQAQRGLWNFKLKAVFTIGILDFVFEDDKENQDLFHHEVKLINLSTNKVFYDKLTFIYLEMPKFRKELHELNTLFEKWLYAIKHLEELDQQPESFPEIPFTHFFEQAKIAVLSDEEYQAYEDSLKVYRDLTNVIDTAKQEGEEKGRLEGLAEGIEKGLAEGIEKGLAEGIEKGLAEGIEQERQRQKAIRQKEKEATIEAMKEMGMDSASIARLLKISEDEIG